MNNNSKSRRGRIAHCVAASALVAAAAVAAPDASAAVDMFLELTNIKGESRDSVHAGDIDVLAWSWGLGLKTTVQRNPVPTSVCSQALSLTKYNDKATPKLMASAVTGSPIATAKLIVRKAGTTPVEYIVITLSNVNVTSLSTGGSGGEDRLTENVTFSFSSGLYEYTEQDVTGKPVTPKISASIPASCP